MRYARMYACPLVLAILAATSASAGAQTAAPVHDEEEGALGQVALPAVPCTPPAAELLRTGLALLHNMTYERARTRFTEAVSTDPDCLLGYWGAAMTYIHPLWPDRPTPEELAAGARLLSTADSRRDPTPHEAAYLGPVHGYYQDAAERTEFERLEAFAAGWEDAARRFPGDPEVKLFRALSLLAAAQGQPDMVATHARAGAMAQEVLREVPDHPGGLHYTIHAFDLPELAERGRPAARAYGEVIPENSHALHMTSHSFTRLGLWEESIAYNRRALDAALRPPLDNLSLPAFFHAADYLVYALLQRGDHASARAVHDRLLELDEDLPPHPAAAYAIAAIPARLTLERRAWEEASRLENPRSSSFAWDRLPHLVAIPTFARGLGAARSGDLEAAESALTELTRLREQSAGLADPFDWATQVRIQERTLEGWILLARGDSEGALHRMEEAARLAASHEKHGVSPGDVLPAAELYGDMLMEVGRHAEALATYETSLERAPNRLNSLYGAGRAAEALGDTETARQHYTRLTRQASESANLERVRRAAAFLSAYAPASEAPDLSVAELREAVEAIARDAMSGNVEGLQSAHLASDEFTKFGPRSFERQDVESANASEAAYFTSVSDLTYEIRDLKIDVFGDVGVATYYPHVTYSRNGERFEGTGRQTFVFLRTAEGWKLVHEHGTPRNPPW